MKSANKTDIREVALPWSQGLLSAHLWKVGKRTAVGVPQLGLHCYGRSETEAVFRLFSSLLKYYRQLKANERKLNDKGLKHLELLRVWVEGMEEKMKSSPETRQVIELGARRRS